ncbi:hypothetical protein [Nonomuraea longicatena]|uniref:hypothetical protein n=1 Tax=Nonomuraea longicatena TaxID=83682 RepID=UPI0031D7D115
MVKSGGTSAGGRRGPAPSVRRPRAAGPRGKGAASRRGVAASRSVPLEVVGAGRRVAGRAAGP